MAAKIGDTKKAGSEVPAWFTAYKAEQDAKIAELNSQLEAERNKNAASPSKRVYAPSNTTPEQALSLAENHKDGLKGILREIAHRMVEVIPGSPKTKGNPFGTPVLVSMKGNANVKMYKIKAIYENQPDGGRGDYKKLRKMVEQLHGEYFSYGEATPLSEDQIKGVLCPLLDRMVAAGMISFDN